jgi:Domain of unknown function (DUF4253)
MGPVSCGAGRQEKQMAMSGLPADGELELGPVRLPAGKRVGAGYGSGGPVAWITLDKVPQAGRVWAALSRAHLETGLVPFLASGLDKTTERPWDQEEFDDPADVTGLGDMDAAVLLQEWWDGSTSEAEEGEEYQEDPEFAEYIEQAIAPFSRQFPGLAPALHESLTPEQLRQALGSRAARIGLAPAARPADVLPLIGWEGAANRHRTALPIAAVLRSWEDRFGARLLDVGFAQIRLLAERPPRTLQAAQQIAAEHFVFCSECGGTGLTEIPAIASHLLKTPIWTFWWD